MWFDKPNTVELEDGSILPLSAIRNRSPSTVRCMPEHVELCERAAKLLTDDPTEFSVYVNHLVIHSSVLLQLSSLLYFLRSGELKARKLVIDVELPNLEEFGGKDLEVEYSKRKPSRNFLRRGLFISFFFKFCAHRLYRLLRRRISPSRQLIRAYVDTTTRAYQSQIQNSVIYIYPFKTNFFRQVEFLRECHRTKLPATRMGLPYPIWSIFGLLWRFRNRDLPLIRIEINAHRAHANEISKAGFATVFSDSESETTGWVLNQELRKQDITTINTCHGVGVYGPYIDFDQCVFYNPMQRQFYDQRARIGKYFYRATSIAAIEKTRSGAKSSSLQIVLLQGNWKNAGKLYELEFETRLTHQLKSIAAELNCEFVIKVHPNTSDSQIKDIESEFGIPAIKHLEETAQLRHVFINTLSTAYYSFMNRGPILFATDHLLDPGLVFGETIEKVTEGNMKAKIQSLQDSEAFEQAIRIQIEQESHEPVFDLDSALVQLESNQ